MSRPPTALITGANGRIGFAFAKLLKSQGYKVYATYNEKDDQIKDLDCEKIRLDLTSDEAINRVAKELHDEPIDLLLNIAGKLHKMDMDPKALPKLSTDYLQELFAINTFAPILLTKALLPSLALSSSPKVVYISSRVGSIAENALGGAYGYRASKAAANSLFKNLAVEMMKEPMKTTVTNDQSAANDARMPTKMPVIIVHPGMVDKEGKARALLPDDAVVKLWALVKDKGIESSGMFFHRDGQELPW